MMKNSYAFLTVAQKTEDAVFQPLHRLELQVSSRGDCLDVIVALVLIDSLKANEYYSRESILLGIFSSVL